MTEPIANLNPSDPDAHLARLLHGNQAAKPWFFTIFHDLKDHFFPAKLPPLVVTSKPVVVNGLADFTGGRGTQAGLGSILIHGSVVALLVNMGSSRAIQEAVKHPFDRAIDLAQYILPPQHNLQKMGGGGGGRSLTPASAGKVPKAAPRQFVPPAAVVYNENPKLVMEPTIVLPTDAQLPDVNLAQWGDLFGRIGPPSNGTGSGSGIGPGVGGGVGPGSGPGVGPGKGGGISSWPRRAGGEVSAPALVYKIDPDYSEEARKAKFQGTVVLQVVVDEKGNPTDLKIVRALGLGLDEKAIEAVKNWRFKPGLLNGKAVATSAQIEVNFRLL